MSEIPLKNSVRITNFQERLDLIAPWSPTIQNQLSVSDIYPELSENKIALEHPRSFSEEFLMSNNIKKELNTRAPKENFYGDINFE